MAWVAMTGMGGGFAWGGCAPPQKSELYSTDVRLTGRTPVVIHAIVPIATDILVTLSPSNIDARLQSVGAEGVVSGAADNPVRRFGPRHLIIRTGAQTRMDFRVVGTEHADAHGVVKLNITPLSAVSTVACIDAYRFMVDGDAAYGSAVVALESKAPGVPADVKAEYRKAVESYRNAAGALAAMGPDPLLAQAYLAASATAYQSLQDWSAASADADRAQTIFAAVHESYGAARARAMKAAADMELALARDQIEQRLAVIRQTFLELAHFHAQRLERFDQALALNNAGLADYYAGHFNRAIETYQGVLPIYAQLGEKPREAVALQNIALTEFELGRFSLAKHDFARALRLTETDPSPWLRGQVLNNQALAEFASGDLDAALEHHGAALTLLTSLQLDREEARALHGIGTVYYAAGDKTQALEYFTRALALRDATRDPRGRMASLRAKASVLSDLHRYPEALQARKDALALAIAPSTRVRIETQLVKDLESLGQVAEARSMADRAVEDLDGGTSAHALALLTRAELRYDAGELFEAERDANDALSLLQVTETPSDQFRAWLLVARIANARHDPSKARQSVERALALAEDLRLQSANPELRAGVWQSLKPAFDLRIELLVGKGDGVPGDVASSVGGSLALQTLATAEMSRARSLADYQRLHEPATGGGAVGSHRLDTLYRELADRRFELETRRDRAGDQDARARAIQADIAALLREIDSQHRVGAGALSRATWQDMQQSLSKLIERIPWDTAVIEYWLGGKQARVWVASNEGVRLIPLGSSDALNRAGQSFYAALRNYGTVSSEQRARLEAALSALVIQPLPADVLRHRSLIIIPDGVLHYIPFAALHEGMGSDSRTLVTNHVLAVAPSLQAAGWKLRRGPPPTRVLIVSDPVYSTTDTRFGMSPGIAQGESAPHEVGAPRLRSRSVSGDFERLPATALEEQAIAKQFAAADVDRLNGFGATREALLGRNLSQYQIIHVAAHGVSDAEAPQLSALVLSLRDARGDAIPGEVFAGELLLKSLNTRLLVLSACDTALGREADGEGLLGLRYAVHAAGAASVIASLWQVPDRSAADLMSTFYEHYLHRHETAAEALAAAMRERLRVAEDPSLWAAFEVSGIGAQALFNHTP